MSALRTYWGRLISNDDPVLENQMLLLDAHDDFDTGSPTKTVRSEGQREKRIQSQFPIFIRAVKALHTLEGLM